MSFFSAAFSQGVAVAILRAPQGLDFSDYIRFLDGVVGKSVGSPRVLENGEMPKFGTQGSFVFVCFKLGN
jgi:hypothetical protein